jgi:hypothetical protein
MLTSALHHGRNQTERPIIFGFRFRTTMAMQEKILDGILKIEFLKPLVSDN